MLSCMGLLQGYSGIIFLVNPPLICLFKTVNATSRPHPPPFLFFAIKLTTTWHSIDFPFLVVCSPHQQELGCFVQHLEQPWLIVGAQ